MRIEMASLGLCKQEHAHLRSYTSGVFAVSSLLRQDEMDHNSHDVSVQCSDPVGARWSRWCELVSE